MRAFLRKKGYSVEKTGLRWLALSPCDIIGYFSSKSEAEVACEDHLENQIAEDKIFCDPR